MRSEESNPSLPADMLLVLERRRRLLGQPSPPHPAPHPSPSASHELLEEQVLAEDHDLDQLVDERAAPPEVSGLPLLELFRPLGAVMLARFGWSGAVDHDSLQEALACCPVPGQAALFGLDPAWFASVTDLRISHAPAEEPALAATMGRDDATAIANAFHKAPRAIALRLLRAAAMPEKVLGTTRWVALAAASPLAAYRTAALVHAWHAVLGIEPLTDIQLERDGAAINLLSTLRAFLGEA